MLNLVQFIILFWFPICIIFYFFPVYWNVCFFLILISWLWVHSVDPDWEEDEPEYLNDEDVSLIYELFEDDFFSSNEKIFNSLICKNYFLINSLVFTYEKFLQRKWIEDLLIFDELAKINFISWSNYHFFSENNYLLRYFYFDFLKLSMKKIPSCKLSRSEVAQLANMSPNVAHIKRYQLFIEKTNKRRAFLAYLERFVALQKGTFLKHPVLIIKKQTDVYPISPWLSTVFELSRNDMLHMFFFSDLKKNNWYKLKRRKFFSCLKFKKNFNKQILYPLRETSLLTQFDKKYKYFPNFSLFNYIVKKKKFEYILKESDTDNLFHF